ncbi:hypothetical protein THIOSC15_1300002 [uncultured Thiomicrorhabdus sp.]
MVKKLVARSQMIREIETLAQRGLREINLLGQNVNAYRGEMEDGEIADLAVLIHAMREIDSIEHIVTLRRIRMK